MKEFLENIFLQLFSFCMLFHILFVNTFLSTLQFLDLFGDAQSIKKADNRHAKLFLRQKSSLVSKKRQAEDLLATDKTKIARTSTDAASSSQSLVGAYPNAQNQWTSGYAQRAPWPQNSQVQGQQWNPGYAPQVDNFCLVWMVERKVG